MMSNKNNKMIVFALVITAMLVTTGCSKEVEDVPNSNEIVENEPIIEDVKVEEEVVEPSEDEKEEPALDINAITLAYEKENVFVYNIAPTEGTVYQTGMPYYVDALNEDGEWEQVDLGLMFTMQIIIVDSENPFTQTVDLTGVEPGEYRISKSILNVDGDVIEDIGSFDVIVREVTK